MWVDVCVYGKLNILCEFEEEAEAEGKVECLDIISHQLISGGRRNLSLGFECLFCGQSCPHTFRRTPANPHSQFWPFPVPPATFDRIHYRTKVIFYTDNKPSRLLLKLNLPHFMLGITMTAFSLDQSSPLLLFCLYMLQWGIGKVVVST